MTEHYQNIRDWESHYLLPYPDCILCQYHEETGHEGSE